MEGERAGGVDKWGGMGREIKMKGRRDTNKESEGRSGSDGD